MKNILMNIFRSSALALVLAFSFAGSVHAQAVTNFNITEQMVLDAQKDWGDALVKISDTHRMGGDYKNVASEIIDAAYNYQNGQVLFKPTLASGEQTFRMDKEGALAYFVGGSEKYKDDSGFAIKGWKSVRIANKGIILDGDTAMSMGNVIVTGLDGSETVVDKTWAWKMDDKGKLRIILHHSSLPYKAAK